MDIKWKYTCISILKGGCEWCLTFFFFFFYLLCFVLKQNPGSCTADLGLDLPALASWVLRLLVFSIPCSVLFLILMSDFIANT